MGGPLIPYLTLPEIPLGFLLHIPVVARLFDGNHPPTIKPFGALVAAGVYAGGGLAIRHARQRQIDPGKMRDFVVWVLFCGLVGAHVLDALFYHPHDVARAPVYLLKLWEGLSSFGGFVGAIIGALVWKLRSKENIMLPYCDMGSSAFPLGWVFGRAGCAVVHDHPGRVSQAWFAVRYPSGSGWVGRYDLGLYEMVLTIPLAVTFILLWRRGPRPTGFYVGWMCASYAPVRFALDFLREPEGASSGADPRYAGLTPAQWACFGLAAIGVYFLRLAAVEASLSQGPCT
jgi:phosphatidylglycerol:prolipoprotein diacylglycerol transferase